MSTPMSTHTGTAPPEHPGFGAAFAYWLKLGFISFGGAAAGFPSAASCMP